MRLYDFLPSGNGYKVRLVLRALGIEFEYHEIDILQGASRTPSFLAKNAFGQSPVLELDDGTCLRESTAILLYVAEGTRLLPSDRLLGHLPIDLVPGQEKNLTDPSGSGNGRV
jgi:glutathione S-transferase